MARAGRWHEGFSFGGRLAWAVGLLLALTLGLSLLAAFGDRHAGPLFELVALRPGAIWGGELWRLLLWFFVQPSPLGLIVLCLLLYWLGGDLAEEWGSRYFLGFFAGVALAAALGTCLVALADRALLERRYLGGWALGAAMLVAWGLTFPHRVVRVYFVVPVTGFWLAWLSVGVTAAFAVYAGWAGYLPELCAQGAALGWLYRGALAARWSKGRGGARRREGRRRELARRRGAEGAAYARAVEAEAEAEALPPLPPEVARRLDELLGGGAKRPPE